MSLSTTQKKMLVSFGENITERAEESLSDEESRPCITYVPYVKYSKPGTTRRLIEEGYVDTKTYVYKWVEDEETYRMVECSKNKWASALGESRRCEWFLTEAGREVLEGEDYE